MRTAAYVLIAFVLMIAESTVSTLFPIARVMPNLLLPMVLWVGVSPELSMGRAAILAFLFGYLLDAFSGNPMGLQTFLAVSAFLLARLGGLRLALRGRPFQMSFTAAVAMTFGLALLALKAIFEKRVAGPELGIGYVAGDWFLTALSTGFCAPIVYGMLRVVDAATGGRSDETRATT